MKLKQFESLLQDLDGFANPKVKFEQYETPSHIAARVLYTAENSFGDIRDKVVADLGCGCGQLTVGAALLEASHVIGFEIDEEALQICKCNIQEMEITCIDLVQADVMSLNAENSRWLKQFDTVILNPPFGTKGAQGVDIAFLKTALNLSTNRVYSLHKTATRDYIIKKAREWNINCKVIASLVYNIPNTYKFHKRGSVDIEVDLFQFSHTIQS